MMPVYLLIIILFALLPLRVSAEFPQAFESHYSLYTLGVKIGESSRRLVRQETDTHWNFESKSYLVGYWRCCAKIKFMKIVFGSGTKVK
jgi:hypothetical protein